MIINKIKHKLVVKDHLEQHFYLQDMIKKMDFNYLVQIHQVIMLDGKQQLLVKII